MFCPASPSFPMHCFTSLLTAEFSGEGGVAEKEKEIGGRGRVANKYI